MEVHFPRPSSCGGRSGRATLRFVDQRDATDYGTSFLAGRGNLSVVDSEAALTNSIICRSTSETRTFTGVGSFSLAYEYNLAGELKKLTDYTGMAINYGYDSAARVNSITGSGNLYAGVSQYASGFAYRAWNGLMDP